MITVTIVAVGSLKEKYLREACAEYEKRLSAYCSLRIIEIPEARLSQSPSKAEIEKGLEKEAAAIIKAVPSAAFKTALCIEGRQLSSEELSDRNMQLALGGKGSQTYIIGSSYGLSEKLKELCEDRISMSRMTFPHQMARMILLEQLYRAFSISAGGKYHK